MKILFTGSSSFTGYWFIKALAAAGHEVVATFQGKEYEGVRANRVSLLKEHCHRIFECPFGSDAFLSLLDSGRWDVLCHHAADVTDYKSPQFDAIRALQRNTLNLPEVLQRLKVRGVSKVVLTGSVFEQREGIGSDPNQAFSPYGLSKGLTADYFHYYCRAAGIPLHKFIIPNPFGPYEEPRLTSFLIQEWSKKVTAVIKTPDYIRDNIHVSLLAAAYADFVTSTRLVNCSPSGYVESQGAFVLRFAEAMRTRLGLPCQVDLPKQESFPEPRMRINSYPVDSATLGWNENLAWDELANYYQSLIGSGAGHG